MSTLGADGVYKKLRFTWKRELNASHDLSRGAKLLAVSVCDTYVNKDSGQFWAKNKTMSAALGVSKRSVQRHLRELEDKGWLRKIEKPGLRRAYQISFPKRVEGDTEHDNLSPSKKTQMAPKHDTAVTPYKNQVNNQRKESSSQMPVGFLLVGCEETSSIAAWRTWFSSKPEFEADQVLQLLRTENAYRLPERFPKEGKESSYEAFFRAGVQTEGRFIA